MGAATVTFTSEMAEVDTVLSRLRALVRTLEPAGLLGHEAMALAKGLGEIEKVVASGLALLSPRVIETGAFAQEGHASAPEWLGSLTGTSWASAKGRLAAAERAAVVPELKEALLAGSLSGPELGVVTKAQAADPESLGTLLGLVGTGASHHELCASAQAATAAARSRENERATRARIEATRRCRVHQVEGGGIRGEFFCSEAAWSRVGPRLDAATKARWRAAGASSADSYAAHRLDALLDLLGTSGSVDGSARPEVLVIVDATALARGTTSTGEICEIDGIGPVPVETAIELLGEGSLRYLVKEGKDIRCVTSASRDQARRTHAAIVARDRVCVVPGCGQHLGLETDHCVVDFSADGPTTYANLARLCPEHHALKTYGKWKLGGSAGHWTWTPPPHPPSAGAISRARRVASAKAQGRAERIDPPKRQ
jgi:hypothetical protein